MQGLSIHSGVTRRLDDLIAGFYLVDDGHTTVGYLWVEHRSAGVGSIGIVPSGHVAY